MSLDNVAHVPAERLGSDILLVVISKFEVLDLVRIVQRLPPSSLLSNVALDQLKTYTKFSIGTEDTNCHSHKDLELIFNYIGSFVRQLTIQGTYPTEFLYKLINKCRRLEDFRGYSLELTKTAKRPKPNFYYLQTLKLINCEVSYGVLHKWFGKCSNNLLAICFKDLRMDDRCISLAPKSIRIFCHKYYKRRDDVNVVAFIKSHPKLEVLQLSGHYDLSLLAICMYLPNVHTLNLNCESMTNIGALALLNKLTTLHLTISVNFSDFDTYPEALDNDNCLTELQLNIKKIEISLKFADALRKFTKLKTFKLYLANSVTCQERLLPPLSSLPELHRVSLHGKVFNLNGLSRHLKQIRILRIDLRTFQDVECLKDFKRVEELQINFKDDYSINPTCLTNIVNQSLNAVSQSHTIQRLGIQALAKVERLYPATLEALNLSQLLHIDLYGVFNGREAIQFVQNTPLLRMFVENVRGMYTFAEQTTLKSIRSEQLQIILPNTSHHNSELANVHKKHFSSNCHCHTFLRSLSTDQ